MSTTPKADVSTDEATELNTGKGVKVKDNTVRTRAASDDERQPGAKIEVGKATQAVPDPSKKTEAPALSASEKLAMASEKDERIKIGTKASSYDAAAEANPSNGKAKGRAKKPARFAPEIVEAVKYARYELAGRNPKIVARQAKDEKVHVPAASGGDHVEVRRVVTEKLEGNVTVEGVVKLTGLKSAKALREAADWTTADTDQLKPLRELSKEFKGNGWRVGRYLAGILTAWVELELRPAEQAARKEAKKAATK